MKLIVIDVGNTSTAVGRWSDGRVSLVSHIDHRVKKNDEEILAAVERANKAHDCEALAYLSVVPKAEYRWRKIARGLSLAFLKIDSRLFTDNIYRDIVLDYPRPETIGADRLADAAAAVDRYGVPVLVADFGTAFTAAIVTEDRKWRGGVIAPGFPLMRDYLFERTAKLPRMELGGKCPKIGRTTEEAMRFGALVGYRGMVREIVATLSKNFKTEFRLIATGGYSSWVLKDSDLPFTIDPTLTLHGAGLLGKLKAETSIEN